MAPRRVACWFSAAILALSLPAAAGAQLAASVSAVSDYRLRGLSLNGGRAALSASLSFDHPSGIYAGASATGGDTRRFGAQFLNHTEYLGFSDRLGSRFAWDVGVSNTQVYSNVFRRFSGNYPEVYAGISSERFSARVFYSPAFIVSDLATVYFDLNGTLRVARRIRAFAHAGLLARVGGRADAVLPRTRHDLRAGVAAEFGRGEVQLAWTRSGAGSGYLDARRQARDALVVGATLFF